MSNRNPVFAAFARAAVLGAALVWSVPAPAADGGLSGALALGPDRAWGARVVQAWDEVRAFYGERGGVPIWFELGQPGRRARAVAQVLADAGAEGLDPADYEADALAPLATADSGAEPAVELRLTGQLLHFIGDLRHGRFASPDHAEKDTFRTGAAGFDVGQILRRLAAAHDIAAEVRGLAPGNVYYRALRRELARHRAMAEREPWPPVAPGPTLKPGMTDARVPGLRARLAASGDVFAAAEPAEPDRYDSVTVESVVLFQRRHGLEPDGVVGPATLAALNVPITERIEQIALNMERWRWMPDDLGERYIVVNLAGFDLVVFDGGSIALEMPVVVGRPFRRTPVFSGAMTHMDFSPTWTLPPTILKEDILPRLRKDPAYLAAKGVDVYDGWGSEARKLDPAAVDWQAGEATLMRYRYVQPPGPANALGRVKFMFPNPFSIYLHDTPDRGLFRRADRAASSGCIRVARPADLAAFLLAERAEWGRERIAEAMAAETPMRVDLAEPVPVHMTYSTAWVGEGGTMQFRADVYGRDADLRDSLAALSAAR